MIGIAGGIARRLADRRQAAAVQPIRFVHKAKDKQV